MATIDFIIQKAGGGTINLYNKNSATLSTITNAEQSQGLNSDDIARITVESAVKITFDIGDKMNILGRWYKINRLPTVKKTGNRLFTYNIELEGVQYDLARVVYDLTIDTTSNALQDVQADMLTGNLQRFATVLIANANRVFPGKWVLGDFPAGTEDKTLAFGETDNCLLVLQRLCSEYNTEFEIIQAGDVNTLHFRKAGQIYPYKFEYGKGKGLYSLERLNVSTSNIVTRLKVYGGTRNITAKYRAARLCLPGKTKGQSYIQKTGPANNYGIWEATKIFEHIYPKRTGTVTAIDSGNVLKLTDSTMNFDLNEKEADGITTKYLIDGSPAKIHFNTGNLSGYEFEIQSYDHATKTFTLKPFEDERGERFPSEKSSAFKFAVNDKYVLLDIALPQSYIDDAEEQLAEEGGIYYDQNSQPKVQYSLEVAEEFLKELSGAGSITNIFSVGDYIPVKDADIDVDKSVRVQSFTRDLLNPFSYKLNISDTVTTNITNRVISELIEIDKITKINDIKSQVKARRDWRSAQELLDMVFDTEGDYYSEKIKPNSIETSMLAVGAKSTQFGLVGTVIQANYNGNKNSVNVKGGTLSHYAIEESGRNWTLADGTTTLTGDSTPYYIYAKCQKVGTAGSIIFSTSKITVDEDPSFYHFLIGVVNSVDIELGVRSVALTYGFTTINGKFIRTGRIQSNDGLTYFDLDTGEIGGKITFRSTAGVQDLGDWSDSVTGDIQDTQQAANDAEAKAQQAITAVDNLQIGGVNLINGNTELIDRTTVGWTQIPLSSKLIQGKTYILGGEFRIDTGTDGVVGLNNNDYGASFQGLPLNTPFVANANMANRTHFCVAKQTGTAELIVSAIKVKLEEGNKKTTWDQAPEYIQSRIEAAKQEALTASNNVQTNVDNLNTYVEGSFKNGIIDEAEAKAIEKYLNTLSETKLTLDASYTQINNNSYLEGAAKTNLASAKAALNTAYTNLVNSINTAIADGKTTVGEKNDVDNKFGLFNTALVTYQTRLEEANKAIQDKLKGYSDNAQNTANSAKLTAEQAQLQAEGFMRARYVRDWVQGNNTNNMNYFSEIKIVLKNGTNIAIGKPVTYTGNPYYLVDYKPEYVNDGDTSTRWVTAETTPATLTHVTIDLGQIYYDIDYIQVLHLPNRTFYNTKTEISTDGVNWTPVFDSAIEGTYKETEEGKIHTQRYASVISKLNQSKAVTDKFGTDITGGLITTVMMLLREVNSQINTAGFSGLQKDANGIANQPSYWSGGTHEQAQAFVPFVKKLENEQSTSLAEYNNLPSIVFLHNGAAKIGHFIVLTSGEILIVDPSTGSVKLKFTTAELPSIADLVTGTNSQGSTAVGAGVASTSSSQVVSGSTVVSKNGAIATFNGTHISISASGIAQAGGMASYAEAVLYARQNGVRVQRLASVTVHFTDTVYENKSAEVLPVSFSFPVDAGTYTFELVIHTIGTISSGNATTSSSNFSWKHTVAGVKKQQYSKDGMMFFYSNRHFYYNELTGLDVKESDSSKFNMPGVLAAGSVSSDGVQANVWGPKSNPAGAGSISGGRSVPLANMKHDNYVVQITPHTATTFRVGTKTISSFQALGTGGFDYVVIGNNY